MIAAACACESRTLPGFPGHLPDCKAKAMSEEPTTVVVSGDGALGGIVVGDGFGCSMEGCRGSRLPVKWNDGRRTYPCTRGLRALPSGAYQIR